MYAFRLTVHIPVFRYCFLASFGVTETPASSPVSVFLLLLSNDEIQMTIRHNGRQHEGVLALLQGLRTVQNA